MAKINLGFTSYSDGELSIKADFIVNCMTGNANFANPEPPLADVSAALDAFAQALTNANGGGKDLTLVKNSTRAMLENLLSNLGLWVQLHSNGDEVILSGSGFDLTKKRTAVGVLPKPVNFAVTPADSQGSVKVRMQAIAGANAYSYEYTTVPAVVDSVWSIVQKTRSSAIIDGLQSGVQYAFKSVALGANPTRVYSDVINSFVL